MTTNKNHWYDGWFFDRFIAPNQDRAFAQVKDLVEPGSTLLDVGCGTGRLGFQLAERCSRVDGIDLSLRNIDRARKNLRGRHFPNVSFSHANVEDFFREHAASYDYAVLSYVIHEIESEKRIGILIELSKHVDKIIAADYFWLRRDLLSGAIDNIVEFSAGKEHYRNFRSFMAEGGLPGLAKSSGLTIVHDIKDQVPHFHIMVLTGRNR